MDAEGERERRGHDLHHDALSRGKVIMEDQLSEAGRQTGSRGERLWERRASLKSLPPMILSSERGDDNDLHEGGSYAGTFGVGGGGREGGEEEERVAFYSSRGDETVMKYRRSEI